MQGWEPFSDYGFNDGVIGVVVVVNEYVTHPRNLIPGDVRLLRQEFWIDVLHRFANLH